jgi:hypothetical protein
MPPEHGRKAVDLHELGLFRLAHGATRQPRVAILHGAQLDQRADTKLAPIR